MNLNNPAHVDSADRQVDFEHAPLDELIGGDDLDLESGDLDPFSVDELLADAEPDVTRISGTDYLNLARNRNPNYQPASVVRGVSLSAVLQMLHLERKSCILDVTGDGGTGTLTLVNGELADAETDELSGTEAVYRILSWHRPQATIIEGVNLFRHTVTLPIPLLLLEAVRRQDEGTDESTAPDAFPAGIGIGDDETDSESEQETWNRLTETLIINGAPIAAVVRGSDENVLALANEFGRLAVDQTTLSLGDLAQVLRLARQWPKVMDPSIEEVTLRIEDRQVLVRPLDRRRSLFACAAIDSAVTLELARHAIISAAR
jgi:hypothetical protein